MLLTALRVRGFRDLSSFEADSLDRVVTVSGQPPAVTALADAIELAFGALDPACLERLLSRWHLDDDLEILDEAGMVEQASWAEGEHLRALIDDGRTIRVDLTVAPDPPLFRELREQAAREPRLAPALAEGASLHLSVGALFTRSLDAVALSVDRIAVGSVGLTLSDGNRWVRRLLRGLGPRFHRHDPQDPVGELALSALTSFDQHDRYGRWASALAPGGPSLRVVQGPRSSPMVLADGRLLDRWGARIQHAAGLAASVHLSGAEIVWAESTEPLLARGVQGAGSPLEQVFIVQEGGALQVTPREAPMPRTAPLPTTLRAAPAPSSGEGDPSES